MFFMFLPGKEGISQKRWVWGTTSGSSFTRGKNLTGIKVRSATSLTGVFSVFVFLVFLDVIIYTPSRL